jgi:hypothetical protein
MQENKQPIEEVLEHLANETPDSLFDAMIGRILAVEILSQEFDVESRLGAIFASGHHGVIENAVSKAKASGSVRLDSVRKLIDNEIEQVRQKPITDYTVVIPLSFNLFSAISLSNQLMELTVQGCEIIFGTFGGLIPQGTMKQLATEPMGKQSAVAPFVAAFSIKTSARDPYFAFVRAWAPADIAASMLEFCLSGGAGVKFPPMPIGSVRLQNCAVVCHGDAVEEIMGRLELVENIPPQLTLTFDKAWKNFKELEARLQAVETNAVEPVKAAVYKALELYGAAVNEPDPNFATLKLWIAMERLVGLGQDINVRTVKSRLTTAFRNKPAIWDTEVKRLLDKRNKLVHRGQFEATFSDAYFAKLVFELTLGLVLKYGPEYSEDKALQALLELGNKDNSALEEVRNAIDYLAKT